MGDGIWLKSGLVESFGGRIMLKKFQGKWDPQSCACFTMHTCCIQTLGIYCGCLANQMVVEFGGDQSYDHMRLHKSFTSNGPRKMALPSQSSNLPPQTNEFFQRKNPLGL